MKPAHLISRRFNNLLLYLLTGLLFIAMFWGASCEGPAQHEYKADSLQAVIERLLIVNEEIEKDKIDQFCSSVIIQCLDSARAWKNVVAINHISITRLNAELETVTFELDAQNRYTAEMTAKYEARLDSAAKIIKRQGDQLKRCVIDSRLGFDDTDEIMNDSFYEWKQVGDYYTRIRRSEYNLRK